MAANQYFTTVTAGGTYSWDAANWNASGSSGNTSPYTFSYVQGNFPRFYNGSALTYSVTVNTDEHNVGMFYNVAGTLNINDAGNGTGNLYVDGSAPQGFFVNNAGGNLNINVPIIGTGGVAPEGTGSLYLKSANTYSGGTALGLSGNTLTYFNNNNAFGSGGISLNRSAGAFSTLLSQGGSRLTIANNFSTVSANTALNFASSANTPVTSSGTWTLGSSILNLRNAGGSTADLTLSGAISGSGTLALSANGTGSQIILSGANTFSGNVIVTGTGGTYGGSGLTTLSLGAANTLANVASLTLAGGKLNLGDFSHTFSGVLNLTANSSIVFQNSASVFGDSSGQSWTGGSVLDLINYSAGYLYFGANGLTSAQLAAIEFNNDSSTLGTAYLDASGYLVPEPSSMALGVIGGLACLGLAWKARRKA